LAARSSDEHIEGGDGVLNVVSMVFVLVAPAILQLVVSGHWRSGLPTQLGPRWSEGNVIRTQ
jgi:hypothetical protein